jgi:nicotinamide-nucleotide amidase
VEVVVKQYEATVLTLGDALRARREFLVAAESCTGGLIAAACTSVAGSSDWFERGFVSYSNAAKTEQLGVPAALIAAHGAVSEPVVRAMAEGALSHAHGDWSIAVTGIAGPGGAVPGKPVGTVWLALAHHGSVRLVERLQFDGDRTAVREQTVWRALQQLRAALAS